MAEARHDYRGGAVLYRVLVVADRLSGKVISGWDLAMCTVTALFLIVGIFATVCSRRLSRWETEDKPQPLITMKHTDIRA